MRQSSPRSAELIRADKGSWRRPLVRLLIAHWMNKGIQAVRVQGLELLREARQAEPGGTLFLANHSSWWDLFLAHVLNEAVPLDGYGMTERDNLVKFGMFRAIGAYSVERTSPASVRAAIAYTVELLSRPEAGVWLFPQGRIACNDVRPLEFQEGIRLIVRRAGRVRVVPTALRYEFWQDERPEALVRFGTPLWCERGDEVLVEALRQRLTAELDALKADGLTQDANRFVTVRGGRESIHDRYARMTRWFRGGAGP